MATTTTSTSKRKKSTNGKSGSTSKSSGSKSASSRTRSSAANGTKRASPSRKRNGAGGSSTSRSQSSSKPATKRSSSQTKPKSGGSRSTSTRSTSSRSKSRRGSSSGKGSQASSGGSGGIVEKAKKPAAAVGVALLGAAGVVAAQRNGKGGVTKLLPGKRSSALSHLPKLGSGLPKPDLKKGMKNIKMPKLDADTIDWVEEKAKGLGDASYRVAEMTDQARKVRKAVGGD